MEETDSKTKVTVLTSTYKIKGTIELIHGARMTDYMAESREFIAMTDVQIWELGDRHVMNTPLINVSRQHVQIITPGH